jgi:hypothetical protein
MTRRVALFNTCVGSRVLNLVVDDEGDERGESERAALNDAISKAWASAQAGEGRPVNEILAALRKR